MKKWGIVGLIALVAIVSATVTSAAEKFTLIVNGQVANVDPVVIDGTTYVPVRAAAELLGVDVKYDNATKTVTLTSDNAPQSDEVSSTEQPYEPLTIDVEKNMFDVEVTVPATDLDFDKVIADAKEFGVSEVIKNDDGTITYRMSKVVHNKMLKELASGFDEYIDELITKNNFKSLKDVEYNDSLTEITIIVDKTLYENSFDGMAAFGLSIYAFIYQAFDGVDPDNAKVTVHVKDEATGDVFDTIVYPDDIQDN